MVKIDRSISPPFHQIKQIKIPNAEWKVLDNNIPVVLLRTGTQPIVRMEFIFPAGKWFEEASGIAAATCSMLIEGTKARNSRQISEDLDALGAFLVPYVESDRAGLVLYSLSRNFLKALDITADLLIHSIFPPHELNIYIQKAREQLLINQKQVSYLGEKGFLKMLFGSDHPYGRPVELSDYVNINQKRVRNHYQRYFQLSDASILVTGNWNLDMLKELNRRFGTSGLETRRPGKLLNFPLSNPANKSLMIPKKEALQSALFIGKKTMNRKDPDYNGFKVLTVLLGGYFGSRLMKNIREDKGYTYGISAHNGSLEHAGYLVISSEVKSEVIQPAIHEVFFEMKRLREKSVDKKELELIRNYLMGNWLSMFDGPFKQATSFRSLLDYGFDESYFSQAINALLKVNSKQLQDLANKYLLEDSFITVVAGKY